MSGLNACKCRPRQVVVRQRMCNYSAFNGYRYTPSDYSLVRCVHCGCIWRTKAAYVARSPNDSTGDEAREKALREAERTTR